MKGKCDGKGPKGKGKPFKGATIMVVMPKKGAKKGKK